MASDNEARRYNNIDGLKKRHERKLEFEGRKHYNLISRNCDGSESVKDVDFKKVESQAIEDPSIHHDGDSFPLERMQFTNPGKMNCISYFPNSHSVSGAANQEKPQVYHRCISRI